MKTDKNKVNGCASQVWLDMNWNISNNSKVFNIEGDSDALIVKGLIAILLSLYKGKTLVEAQAVDPRVEFECLFPIAAFPLLAVVPSLGNDPIQPVHIGL